MNSAFAELAERFTHGPPCVKHYDADLDGEKKPPEATSMI